LLEGFELESLEEVSLVLEDDEDEESEESEEDPLSLEPAFLLVLP
jgi:hypothetical protein